MATPISLFINRIVDKYKCVLYREKVFHSL